MAHEPLFFALRQAVRSLRKQPGFSVIAVLTLALGIGANTAVFSVLDAAVLHPLPYPDPERLLMLRDLQGPIPRANVSFPEFVDWRTRGADIAEIGALFNTSYTVGGDRPQEVQAQRVSSNLFQILGVSPLLGRHFQNTEDARTANRVVAISETFWERELESDPHVLGRALILDDTPYTIVAVMPRDFRGVLPRDISTTRPKELWLPLQLDESGAPRGMHVMTVLARLRPGITHDQARERLAAMALGLKREDRTTHGVATHSLVTYVAQGARPMLLALSGAVAVVLLMACANLANLLLARGTARRREIAIRAAIGAGPRWIVSEFLFETCVLAVIGGAVGLILAVGVINLISRFGSANSVNLSLARLDLPVLAFTAVISLATGILFAIAPVIQALKTGVLPLLKESGRPSSGTMAIRSLLVTIELASAVLLLVAAGLLARSFANIVDTPKGFDAAGVLTFSLSASRADALAKRHGQFFVRLLDGLSANPQMTSAGLVNELPLGGGGVSGETPIEGKTFTDGQIPVADKRIVSPRYFEIMGIPLIRGRTFSEVDRAGAVPVAIVSEMYAQRYFPGEDPIGRRVSFAWDMEASQEIIGIVGDVRHEGLDISPEPTIYVNYEQRPSVAFSVVVRSKAPVQQIASDIRATVRELDASRPISTVRTLTEVIDASVAPRQLALEVIGIFAMVAVVLAAVGVYGVASYNAQQRTTEIGLRVALGAQTADVVALVIGKNIFLTIIGIGAGLSVCVAVRNVIDAYLFAVTSTDMRTLLLASAMLAAVALIASYVPIRRALRMSPVTALQSDPR